jgi:hypothetical protein
MDFELYRLPNGRIIRVDATASKGAKVIGFTEVGGRVVDATLVDDMPNTKYYGAGEWLEPKNLDGRL